MKYLRLFLTHAEHEQEKDALEKLELYTSYCEDNDEVTIFYLKKLKPKYEVGDYLLSSGEVIKNKNYTSGMDVIGVCVIPDNFISKTGVNSKARFCALTESQDYQGNRLKLKYKTSDTEDTVLSMFNNIGCVGESESGDWTPTNILTHNRNMGAISSQVSLFENDKTNTVENPYDPGTYWYPVNEYHYIASPYLYVNGEYVFNEGVYNGCVDGAVSMLSDMDGKANTTVINDAEHPSAQYCATYSTAGTSAGDWYLPAMGELAFIIPRFDTINEAITKVDGTTFDIGNYSYWSSTLYSADLACNIAIFLYGIVGGGNKSYTGCVRPFFRLD